MKYRVILTAPPQKKDIYIIVMSIVSINLRDIISMVV